MSDFFSIVTDLCHQINIIMLGSTICFLGNSIVVINFISTNAGNATKSFDASSHHFY